MKAKLNPCYVKASLLFVMKKGKANHHLIVFVNRKKML